MSPSLVASTSSWIVDLLNQRRSATAELDPAASSPDAPADLQQPVAGAPAGQAGSAVSSDAAFFQSAMKTDLSMILIVEPAGAAGDETSSNTGTATEGSAGAAIAAPPRSSFLHALDTLLASTLSGDATGTKDAALALQADIQKATGSATDPGASNAASQGPFLDDLQKLISTALSGDTTGAQQAASAVAKDIQGAIGGHHHHHHADVQTAGPAASTGATDAPQSTSTSSEGTGGALAAAKQAYELLMSFATGNVV